MKSKLIIDHNSDELIIFVSGWGCDDHQFAGLTSSKDVLLLWDYKDLSLNYHIKNYKKCYLLSYSAGVFVAGLLEDSIPILSRKIALNGNPEIFSAKYGLTKQITNVFRNITVENAKKFCCDYLLHDPDEFSSFIQYPCLRTPADCTIELDCLEEMANNNKYHRMKFDTVFMSECDKIFNPENQRLYYKQLFPAEFHQVPKSGHNIFYSKITNLDDFFDKQSLIYKL